MREIKYRPAGSTLRNFMKSNVFVRGLRGPVGSGKTACCCVEIFRRACEQEKGGVQNKRKTRWAIIRNSYPELRTTTIKTWLDWFPEANFGPMKWHPTPYVHHIIDDEIDCEVLFVALDRPDDVKKMLSLELTGAFVNEAREVSKTLIDAVSMRLGRYPSARDGGPTWYGMIMDTNAPDDDHWWPIMAGEAPIPDYYTAEESAMMVKPEDWAFFNQPPAMFERYQGEELIAYDVNPEAENIENLPKQYYPRIITGKDREWINVYVRNQLGNVALGKPIYKDFRKPLHVPGEAPEIVPGVPLFVGVDFGLTPAAIICQKLRGVWLVHKELIGREIGAKRFARVLKGVLSDEFAGCKYRLYGDPSGDYRAQTDETTPFRLFRAAGLQILAAPTNDVVLRVEAVASLLTRLEEGKPAIWINPACRTLIKGFEGSYCYRRLQVSGERYADEPEKNNFSHIHDALQYATLGGGEGRDLLNQGEQKPHNARSKLSVFDRYRRQRQMRRTGRSL